jgi:hypothetical protein
MPARMRLAVSIAHKRPAFFGGMAGRFTGYRSCRRLQLLVCNLKLLDRRRRMLSVRAKLHC